MQLYKVGWVVQFLQLFFGKYCLDNNCKRAEQVQLVYIQVAALAPLAFLCSPCRCTLNDKYYVTHRQTDNINLNVLTVPIPLTSADMHIVSPFIRKLKNRLSSNKVK